MSTSLWPDLSQLALPREMPQILMEAAGDIEQRTGGKLRFWVDTVGISGRDGGGVRALRHNCYLLVARNEQTHFLFRVEHALGSLWPATLRTPEKVVVENIGDEQALRDSLADVLNRDWTKRFVGYVLAVA